MVENQEQKVCKLKWSSYGLKQGSRSWNSRFDGTVKTYSCDRKLDEPFVYKLAKDDKVVSLILYIDYIMLIRNSVELLSNVKTKWMAK